MTSLYLFNNIVHPLRIQNHNIEPCCESTVYIRTCIHLDRKLRFTASDSRTKPNGRLANKFCVHVHSRGERFWQISQLLQHNCCSTLSGCEVI